MLSIQSLKNFKLKLSRIHTLVFICFILDTQSNWIVLIYLCVSGTGTDQTGRWDLDHFPRRVKSVKAVFTDAFVKYTFSDNFSSNTCPT